MADWPEFELTSDDGTKSHWTRDLTKSNTDAIYRVGVRGEADYVLQEPRKAAPDWGLGKIRRIVLAIRVEAEKPKS
jgi:hypothetical protein